MTNLTNPVSFQNGEVFFYYEKTYGTPNVCDIDVAPGTKTVTFGGEPGRWPPRFSLQDVNKSFPDVEELIIEMNVCSISISNFMFPNVKKVTSYSRNFKSAPYLICNNVLQNTFCKQPDEIIDLQGIQVIESYAFEGCLSTHIQNTKDIHIVKDKAFSGSAFLLNGSEKDGSIMAGTLLIGASQKDIVLPAETTVIAYHALSDISKITVNNHESLSLLVESQSKFDTLFINMKESIYNQAFLESIRSLNIKNVEVCDEAIDVKTIDGILYSKDGKSLLYCPKLHEVSVSVLDGVENICDDAFYMAYNIQEVIFPASLKRVGRNAFSGCNNLLTVDFGTGVEILDENSFSYCRSLKQVDIPASVKIIQDSAFCGCRDLEKVTLHSGLQYIGCYAFDDCVIKEVTLPETVCSIGRNAFCMLSSFKAEKYLPHTLFAICKDFENYTEKAETIVTDMEINGHILYVPVFLPRQKQIIFDKILSVGYSNEDIMYDFLSAISSAISYKHAFALYLYKKEETKELTSYLRKAGRKIAERFIQNNNESELVSFLKYGLLTENTLKTIFDKANAANMTSAASYILQQLDEVATRKTFRL